MKRILPLLALAGLILTGAGCKSSGAPADPILRLALPAIRQMMWSMGIPMFAGRGFRNLLRDAESAAKPKAATARA